MWPQATLSPHYQEGGLVKMQIPGSDYFSPHTRKLCGSVVAFVVCLPRRIPAAQLFKLTHTALQDRAGFSHSMPHPPVLQSHRHSPLQPVPFFWKPSSWLGFPSPPVPVGVLASSSIWNYLQHPISLSVGVFCFLIFPSIKQEIPRGLETCWFKQ